ncbi:hypothetical protein NVP1264O_61 [Vibrio phage 1.264.O._10N.286.51.F2]|nr:hypothetical protein NVP1264O_61 [Vibrio phage 1.264.O._10N.286.51.F2]
MEQGVKPRIYVVTSKCGKYAWVTSSNGFDSRTLGQNAKSFCDMIKRVYQLRVFQGIKWEMRWHKAHTMGRHEFKDFMTNQLTSQGYTVIQ